MKRIVSVFLALCLMLTALTGCGGGEKQTASTPYTAAQIAGALAASQREMPALYAVTRDDPEFAPYSMLYLGDSAGACRDGVICTPFGVSACEIAVFELPDPTQAAACVQALTAYRDERVGAFFGYAPAEAELAGTGLVLTGGCFAALVICHDNDAARAAWEGCFAANPAPAPSLFDYVSPLPQPDTTPDTTPDTVPDTTPDTEPDTTPDTEPDATPDTVPDTAPDTTTDTMPDTTPEKPDVYDHDAVLTAVESGDPSGLTPKNLAVYKKCRKILDRVIEDGMTPVEKELAINDYLVYNAKYDPAELTNGPVGTPDPDNDNPYGLLVHGVGICLGYATSFQLFMDILGIECMTVRGWAYNRTEEHAWNLVRLDGEWYAVDVTWNDPVFGDGDPPDFIQAAYAHAYFNVTSDFMRGSDHQWDGDVPEAEGTRWAYWNL